MPRLLRPHIPVEGRVRVVLRQLGELFPDGVIDDAHACSLGLRHVLEERLMRMAELLACAVADLRLDHDPALGARKKVFKKGVHVGYIPDANDPEHLFYRDHRSHLVKTNIRGLHGQHPDRVLIKKHRRYEKGIKVKPKKKWRSRPFSKGKQKIRSRPFGKKNETRK